MISKDGNTINDNAFFSPAASSNRKASGTTSLRSRSPGMTAIRYCFFSVRLPHRGDSLRAGLAL